MISKCNCLHCGQPVEFETEQYQAGMILDCPHCQQPNEVRITRNHAYGGPSNRAAARTHAGSLPNHIAIGYVLAVLFPFIGFFYGIYLMAKQEPGHGVACMAISLVCGGLWSAVLTSAV